MMIVILLTSMAGLWGPFNSILIKHIIDILPLIGDGDVSSLTWPAALIVLNFIVFDNFTWRGKEYINYKYQAVIKKKIIRATMNQLLGESHQFFQDRLSGRIANQITILADNIELIVHNIVGEFLRGAALVIVALIASYIVNLIFFYVLFLWFIAFASFSIMMSRRFVALADQHAETESILSGQLVDSIANHTTVRIFSRKSFEISRLKHFFLEICKAFQKKESFRFMLYTVQGGMIATMMGVSSYFLIHLYSLKLISIGDFALIFGLSMELGHTIWYTMSRVDDFHHAFGKCKQSLDALVVQREVKDKCDAKELLVESGSIIFDNVKFHYKGTEPLFQNQSVSVEAGQKVGLVGYSGSGKTTFVNLILRLYDVTDGDILIDGQDIRNVTQNSLRQNIAMIPQDPSLFHRSIMENIRYGRMDASDEEVMQASNQAHAHEFIATLPHGYESLVGERGLKLSGGQRQRIAIARAMLKNAPILMLDEATSQLDSITEANIQSALRELMHNKTTLVIAHRLSTLLYMDRIIVFDRGKIVEDGTHAALFANNALYKTLWDAQIGGFLPDAAKSL